MLAVSIIARVEPATRASAVMRAPIDVAARTSVGIPEAPQLLARRLVDRIGLRVAVERRQRLAPGLQEPSHRRELGGLGGGEIGALTGVVLQVVQLLPAGGAPDVFPSQRPRRDEVA